MVGEKRVPDWAIYNQTSTLRMHAGQDSWELFNAILCIPDQAILGRKSHVKVEENFAHCMMKACAFGHNLSLKCCTFHEGKKLLATLNINLLLEVEALKAQISELKTSNKTKVADLEAQLQRCTNEIVNIRLKALDEGEQKAFDQGRTKGFEEGLVEGRAIYLSSHEHQALLPETRVAAARDFMKCPAFGVALEIKTAKLTIDAFELCRAQVNTLGGFVAGFNSRLDPTLHAKIQIPVMEEPPAAEPNEFDVPMDEIKEAAPEP
ncbi:hypothetical protein Salat_2113900 [Sesamum alatum]|uniref:Uncharacterized protein n=1 Tax=Sesamum alatum TaxID=300844 RepID=A0AAE1Y222_9LAMI|nr:hypothetical protein Salat_2113900 [Sesamum alatum]